MSTPVQHCLITGAYLPIIKRRVNLCSTYIQFQDNYPSEYKRFGIGRDEMMILMPQVMGVDVLSGLDKLKYVGEEEGEKCVSAATMEMKTENKLLKEMDEEDDERNVPLDRIAEEEDEGARDEAIINALRDEQRERMRTSTREGMNSSVREGMSSSVREGAIINMPHDERQDELPHELPDDRPHRMRTDAHERMTTSAQFSDSDSNDYSDDYYDYDVDIDEDYDTDEEFTDDYDD